MTQAFNLSQLANFVNTTGQLNAATALFNQTPVANGGTGLSTVTSGALLLGAGTSAMTELTGTTPGTVVASSPTGWSAQPQASVGGGDYAMAAYTSPNVYTKPGILKAIKVTVVGSGGNGSASPNVPAASFGGGGGGGGAAFLYLDAPALPASPITITAGSGTNSFGPFVSATAGAAGPGGAGGTGISGTVNMPGQPGTDGGNIVNGGGQSHFGFGGQSRSSAGAGRAGGNYGGGGGGGAKASAGAVQPGGAGAPGVVIIEEFY